MSRIYIIKRKHRQDRNHRLVRSSNAAQARNHVACDELDCVVASQDDLIEQLAFGVKVEDAGEALPVGQGASA